MNPQQSNQGSFEVPAPQQGASPASQASNNGGSNQPTPAAPLPPLDTQQTALPPRTAASVAPPAVADDLDLIEKEWVEKAKKIVSNTHNDPYNQNKEMNKFKADYMKKRYGKDIKLEDK